jgi:hypothetical protein
MTSRSDSKVATVEQSSPASSAARPVVVREQAAKPVATIALNDSELRSHVKPILNSGANVQLASDGFRDAEQFVTVAHAARNTKVPFALLKHRVLTEGKSLSAAIRESNSEIDASLEAERAQAEARSDIAKLARS